MSGLVKAAQHVEDQAFVVAGFKVRGVELAGLANGGQRIFKLAGAALNFRDVHERLGVFGIGLGQRLVLLQGIVELVIAQQGLRQGIDRVQVARLHIGRALIGGDGVLGLL